MSIGVIIADDHSLIREGIKVIVEGGGKDIEIIGEASNGKDVLKMAKNKPADVYVLDISMPVLNGIETAGRLMKMDPKSRIIILSIHDERIFVEKALQYGAKGYVLKESATEEIVHAICEVYLDRFFLSPKISRFIVQGFLGRRYHYRKGHEKVIELTRKEREILQLIAEGLTNKEIARQLRLSLNTVHVHRNNIMRKLGIHRQAGLVRYALKEGICQL